MEHEVLVGFRDSVDDSADDVPGKPGDRHYQQP
jgi:hypothetical protein